MQTHSDSLAQELQLKLEQKRRLLTELRVRRAIEDPFFWMTECTNTKDEQAEERGEEPYRPFPKWDYIKHLLDALDNEPVVRIEKSRTMMATWTVSAWCAHRMFTRKAFTVVFQSEDKDRALVCVDYVKTLYDQSIPELKARWPLLSNPTESMSLKNGSWCIAISGDSEKIRSEHPSTVILDEAAHITQGEKSYNNAVNTRCPKIIALSSCFPGWFEKLNKNATPVDWPEYRKKKEAA